MAWPAGVEMAMWPDVALAGTVVLTWVFVALVTAACEVLNVTLSLARMSKLVPLMDTAVPAVPMAGVKLVIVGAPEFAATVKLVVLVADPEGLVTVIGPVVAAAGTVATI